MHFIREDNGMWKLPKKIKNAHATYQPALEKYLNLLDPFFSMAKEKCEFEFILSLLRVRGLASAGWDTFETLEETHKSFYKITKKFKNDNFTCTQFSLFIYGLIIEASEPYELLANLINVIEGGRFNPMSNFSTHGKKTIVYPSNKIDQLKKRAKKVKLKLDLFDDFFDNNLRNSIFHSDYAIYRNEVRLMNPMVAYKRDEWHKLINGALAYFEALMTIYKFNIGEYKEPKIIKPHPGFKAHKDERSVTITRKGYGLIGMKDNWTPKQIARGHIPHQIGRFNSREQKLIRKGELIMPKNRIKQINKVLGVLPSFISKWIVKKISKYFY